MNILGLEFSYPWCRSSPPFKTFYSDVIKVNNMMQRRSGQLASKDVAPPLEKLASLRPCLRVVTHRF